MVKTHKIVQSHQKQQTCLLPTHPPPQPLMKSGCNSTKTPPGAATPSKSSAPPLPPTKRTKGCGWTVGCTSSTFGSRVSATSADILKISRCSTLLLSSPRRTTGLATPRGRGTSSQLTLTSPIQQGWICWSSLGELDGRRPSMSLRQKGSSVQWSGRMRGGGT